MPRKATFRAICAASRYIDGPELARDLTRDVARNPARTAEIWVFQVSGRFLRPPTAQIRHMGTEKSNGEIKNIAAPPASAYSTPKIVVQKQKLLYRDVHGSNVENRRKNMQKFQLFCERKNAAYLLGLVIIFRTSLAVPTVWICSGDVPLLLCISLRQ